MEEFDISRIKLLLLAFLILTLSSGIGAAAVIHVNQTSIQAAVNSAGENDIIIVHPGTYTENIEITRTNNLTITSVSGDPVNTTIASNSTGKDVISVRSRSNVVIKGFTISGASNDTAGVRLNGCRGCTVENNKFLNDALGVYAVSSINTKIRNNTDTRTNEAGKIGRGIDIERCQLTTVSNNTISNHRYGIHFSGSDGNTISGNSVSQCAEDGMILTTSNSNTLEKNIAKLNVRYGICLSDSNSNILIGNKVSNGNNGIYLVTSPENVASGTLSRNNTISGNTIDFSSQHDIMLENTTENTIKGNTVSSSPYGIAVRYSYNNNLIGNNAYNNTRGFYITLWSSKNILSGNKANSNTNGFVLAFNTSNNILKNNEANSNSGSGIALDNSISNEISNNNISLNNRGVYLNSLSRWNNFSSNTVNFNKGDGIRVENSSENNLVSNVMNLNKDYGVYLANSNNTSIVNNTVQNNKRGISLSGSLNNTISENKATDSIESGLFLTISSNNDLSQNIIDDNGEGISLDSSESNVISGNDISSNGNGIYMCPRSYGNYVYDNCFNNINNANIRNNRSIWNMEEKTPGKNIMGGPTRGGNFWGTPSLMGFSDNESNPDVDEDGIIDIPFISANGYTSNPNGNITDSYPLKRVILPVADFSANPTKGVIPLKVEFKDLSKDATSISWDVNDDGISDGSNSTLVYVYNDPGTYTASLTAENYNGTDSKTVQIIVAPVKLVADFTANVTSGYAPLSVLLTDKSQNATSISWDFTNDGIGDSNESKVVYVYTTPGNYTVNLTASNKNSMDSKTVRITVEKIKPVANFNANPTSGYAPLSVQFTDLSQYATSCNWNFGDGATSTEKNTTHTYSAAGTYTVRLTATNENGTSPAKTATITVTKRSSSGGSSGGSGGGGGGGSPEPAKNVQVKELSQTHVASGKPVKFDFAKNATCVVYVGFDAKKTAGKTTTIAEQLKAKSTLTSNLSSGEAYRYFNLWVGNAGFATEKNIENPVICFKVEKSWLQDKKIDRNSITLNRYSDKKWSELPAKLLREDDKYLYFTAETPGFTFFAITGKAVDKPTADTKPVTDTSELEQNSTTVSETEQEQKTGQETGKDSVASIPGFEGLCVVACLITLFMHKRK